MAHANNANQPQPAQPGFFARLGVIPTIIIVLVCMLLIALAGQGILVVLFKYSIPSIKEMTVVMKEMNEISTATPIAPVKSADAVSVAPESHTMMMFDCGDSISMAAGFARGDVQVVGKEGSYSFSSGCALVRADLVKTLSGNGYTFQQETSPGNFYGCGTVGMSDGRARTLKECTVWLNQRIGQNIQLIIQNGGNVVINGN